MGEIRIFPFAFAPQGCAQCNGQILPSNQYTALSTLLYNTYGGDGTNNFGLPDLQGRVAVHVSQNGQFRVQGERGGQEGHALTVAEIPPHQHKFMGVSKNAAESAPQGGLLATASNVYTSPQNLTPMHPETIGNAGSSAAHDNMQPYLALNFCIALNGAIPIKPTS